MEGPRFLGVKGTEEAARGDSEHGEPQRTKADHVVSRLWLRQQVVGVGRGRGRGRMPRLPRIFLWLVCQGPCFSACALSPPEPLLGCFWHGRCGGARRFLINSTARSITRQEFALGSALQFCPRYIHVSEIPLVQVKVQSGDHLSDPISSFFFARRVRDASFFLGKMQFNQTNFPPKQRIY